MPERYVIFDFNDAKDDGSWYQLEHMHIICRQITMSAPYQLIYYRLDVLLDALPAVSKQ